MAIFRDPEISKIAKGSGVHGKVSVDDTRQVVYGDIKNKFSNLVWLSTL